jgi:hypothetical protein
MNVTTKFDVGNKALMIWNNQLQEVIISGVKILRTGYKEWNTEEPQSADDFHYKDIDNQITYAVSFYDCDEGDMSDIEAWIDQNKLFRTKQELIDSL